MAEQDVEGLRLRRFRQWLGTFEPDAIVGYARLNACCPLAWHLRHINGATHVDMSYNRYTVRWGDAAGHITWHTQEGLRKWARSFMAHVDKPDWGTPITAAEALEALEAAVRLGGRRDDGTGNRGAARP